MMTDHITEAYRVSEEAFNFVEERAERVFEAELYRLRGELCHLAQPTIEGPASTPEDCFHRALEIARRQQAKSWKLRAATSLARLWQSQDKRRDAYDLLAPVYGWFSEGFDTADLEEAKGVVG
jgi:predicted ATPase